MEIARRAVAAAVAGRQLSAPSATHEELERKCGAFVTLKTRGRLRGCIGQFTSDEPLWKTVQAVAVSSAKEDPRFAGNRLTPDELKELELDISVLSPLRRIEDPLDFELGKHGVYIKRGYHSGCFLPQVAVETGWSKEKFLTQCATGKAGLAPDAWKHPDTEVYIFDAEIIS